MSKITVVVKRPNTPPTVELIDNRLETLQALVGGYIESVSCVGDVRLIVNEDGRAKNMPLNFTDPNVGMIRGTAIIVPSRVTPAGNFVSFTPAQAARVVARFTTTPVGPLTVFQA